MVVILFFAAVAIPFVFKASGLKVFQVAAVGGGGPRPSGILWRSQDAGNTWEETEISSASEEEFPARILDLAFHPRDPETLYVGAKSSGFWRSINAGKTWEKIFDASGALDPEADVYRIVVSRANPAVMYLAVLQGRRGKVLRSDDEGRTFREVYAVTPAEGPVYDLYVASSTPQHLFITTGHRGMLESRDGGAYWKVVQWFREPLVRLAVNPLFQNEMYAVNRRGDLQKTFDSGTSWIDLQEGVREADGGEGKLFGPDPGVFPLDFLTRRETRVLLLDPRIPARLFLGSWEGLFRSSDGGFSWERLPLVVPPGALEVGAVTRDPRDKATIFAGAGPHLFRSGNGGIQWKSIPLPTKGNIAMLAVHPLRPDIMFMAAGK